MVRDRDIGGEGNVKGGRGWSNGVLECWSVGVLECWSVGVLECWSVGAEPTKATKR